MIPGLCTVGEHTYVGDGMVCHVPVSMGKYTSVASALRIVSGQHPPIAFPNAVANYPLHEQFGVDYHPSKMDGLVYIGSDVWIGEAVTILEGVSVNNGAIVAAGSLVTKDVPPYAVVAGNPAEIKRLRFDAELITHLELIRWWNWPHEKVLENAPLMKDVYEFVGAHWPYPDRECRRRQGGSESPAIQGDGGIGTRQARVRDGAQG